MHGASVAADVAALLGQGIRHVELSGGRYTPTLREELGQVGAGAVFQIHNYFPPPREPLVLNLGSLDQAVAGASLEHMREAIRWAVALGRPVYSFHAGFLVDPKLAELGRKIAARPLFDRGESLRRFVDRVGTLALEAEREGVSLLVENNVVAPANFAEFGRDPLLLTGPDEAAYIMENTPDNVGLLVDVAHLKVSAQTLDFDPLNFLERCDRWIRGYHLSDNDGSCDSNDPVAADSWFWPHLKRDLESYTLEVYRRSPAELAAQQRLVQGMLADG